MPPNASCMLLLSQAEFWPPSARREHGAGVTGYSFIRTPVASKNHWRWPPPWPPCISSPAPVDLLIEPLHDNGRHLRAFIEPENRVPCQSS